jgi:hypothetical protein
MDAEKVDELGEEGSGNRTSDSARGREKMASGDPAAQGPYLAPSALLRTSRPRSEEDWTHPIEPWTEAVDGGGLLDELVQVLRRFVVLPPQADVTLALWVVHTYAFHLRDVSTYVGIESPETRYFFKWNFCSS